MIPGNWHLLLPVAALASGAVLSLVSGLRKSAGRGLAVSTGACILAAILALCISGAGDAGPCFRVDAFSRFFLVLGALSAAFALVQAARSSEITPFRFPEFSALLLTAATGIALAASAKNLLSAYLAMETVSLPSYVIAGFRRRHPASHEAALKYVIVGGVASAVMVFGMSLLYGLTGTLDYAGVAAALGGPGSAPAAGIPAGFAAVLCTTLILAGFFFKIAAVPFHMWCPDVYEGAPLPFTAFLSVAPKAAGFALILRFLMEALPASGGFPRGSVALLIGVISAVTMTAGNLSAIHQTRLKRLLAYSSIAHAGYLLMGVCLINRDGTGSALLYLGIYPFMNLGAFAAVQAVSERRGSDALSAFRGLGTEDPLTAVLLTVCLFSLAGLPPLAGFIGKFYLFASLLRYGGTGTAALAVVGILNSVVALFYYARIVAEMFMRSPESPVPPPKVKTGMTPLLLITALPLLVFGVYWEPLRRWAEAAAAALK
jgi:NADH-quinone oxidoreductase subunit N